MRKNRRSIGKNRGRMGEYRDFWRVWMVGELGNFWYSKELGQVWGGIWKECGNVGEEWEGVLW